VKSKKKNRPGAGTPKRFEDTIGQALNDTLPRIILSLALEKVYPFSRKDR
jgi:hypothetical protein